MEVTRIFDLLERYATLFPKDDVFGAKRNGTWITYSTKDYIEISNNVSLGFLAMGIKKGDKIVTISTNRPEWNFVDIGMCQIGAVHVPVYSTLSDADFNFILRHSDAKIIFVSDKQIYNKIAPIVAQIPTIENIFSFNELQDAKNWNEIVELGKQNTEKFQNQLVQIKSEIKPEDLASIIYTSGTTGVSKGVMLSHKNIVSNMKSAIDDLPLDNRHKILSLLPLCHVYERLVLYIFQYKGISIYYAENIATIVENIRELKVDGFNTVPRLLEKVYDVIMEKGAALKGIKRKLFDWAVKLGLRYEINNANGWWYALQLSIANKLVFSKWREALGGNIKYIGCGGASLQLRLARLFWAAGIPIQEGYGLTETSPLIAFNSYCYPGLRLGTVGRIVKDVSVKIADDGEILVKGPNVMMGYYKNPELTAQVIDNDGYFHTGDIGTLVDNQFLKITDRKKEIFKTANGKYIAPQVIENRLKESWIVEQAMVVGENEKFASALISPKFDVLRKWSHKNEITYNNNVEIIQHPKILQLFQTQVNEINATLGDYEKIKRFRLVPDEWNQNTGELSPTLKLKRKFIVEKYQQTLDEIYSISKNEILGK